MPIRYPESRLEYFHSSFQPGPDGFFAVGESAFAGKSMPAKSVVIGTVREGQLIPEPGQ